MIDDFKQQCLEVLWAKLKASKGYIRKFSSLVPAHLLTSTIDAQTNHTYHTKATQKPHKNHAQATHKSYQNHTKATISWS